MMFLVQYTVERHDYDGGGHRHIPLRRPGLAIVDAVNEKDAADTVEEVYTVVDPYSSSERVTVDNVLPMLVSKARQKEDADHV